LWITCIQNGKTGLSKDLFGQMPYVDNLWISRDFMWITCGQLTMSKQVIHNFWEVIHIKKKVIHNFCGVIHNLSTIAKGGCWCRLWQLLLGDAPVGNVSRNVLS
jgi:hypothetical protein